MLGMTNNREPVKGKIAKKIRSILKRISFKKEKIVYVLLERWDFGDYPDSMVVGAYTTFKDALARLDRDRFDDIADGIGFEYEIDTERHGDNYKVAYREIGDYRYSEYEIYPCALN